ncbi:hypothetical protein COU74_01490 [Candidatus Peregrinibacteria bacterium CG10_big_fil_rev_8_21_14_0_10_36_19]|nr:MAG: hypothetical protein COU74_01490 [Candidatus Peregrinibacteria bacterium CG10_big_fil_rev_8_21_14_0_10_36_19]
MTLEKFGGHESGKKKMINKSELLLNFDKKIREREGLSSEVAEAVQNESKNERWRKAVECENLISQGRCREAMPILEERINVWGEKYVYYLMDKVAKNDEVLFFEKYDLIADKRWGSSLLKRALSKAMEFRKWLVFEHADLIEDEKYADRLFLKAATDVPWAAVVYYEKYKNSDKAAKILEYSLSSLGGRIFSFTDMLLKFDDNLDVVGNALYKHAVDVPGEAFENLHKIVSVKWPDTNWTEKIVREAAGITPWLALRFANVYKEEKFAADVIELAAKKMPSFALEYADKFADQDFAARVIRLAAKESPSDAVKYFDKYVDVLNLNSSQVLAEAKMVANGLKNS